jgi:hypothetical protein
VKLGGVIDDLIHRQRDEILEHDVDDRAASDNRRTDADTANRVLADGRVAHALASEFLDEPCVTLKAPPYSAMSSPRMNTLGSRSISSAIASRSAQE